MPRYTVNRDLERHARTFEAQHYQVDGEFTSFLGVDDDGFEQVVFSIRTELVMTIEVDDRSGE